MKLFLYLSTIILFSISCTKYDEGGVSINAKQRISKSKWSLNNDYYYFIRSAKLKQNSKVEQCYFEFRKNSDAYEVFVTSDSSYYYKIGMWDIVNNYKIFRLYINYSISNEIDLKIKELETGIKDTTQNIYPDEYIIYDSEILKLTDTEFWLTNTKYKAVN